MEILLFQEKKNFVWSQIFYYVIVVVLVLVVINLLTGGLGIIQLPSGVDNILYTFYSVLPINIFFLGFILSIIGLIGKFPKKIKIISWIMFVIGLLAVFKLSTNIIHLS